MYNLLLVLLLTNSIYFTHAIWNDCDGEKCIKCLNLEFYPVLQAISTKHRTVVNITSELGTGDLEDYGQILVKRQEGETKNRTTMWTVDEPGAIFFEVHAVCKLECKDFRDPWTIIYGIAKFSVPSIEECIPEDYYVDEGELVENYFIGTSPNKYAKVFIRTGTIWLGETDVQQYLKRTGHTSSISYAWHGEIEDQLHARFSNMLNSSKVSGVAWHGVNLPDLVMTEEPISKFTGTIYLLPSDNKTMRGYSLVGKCGPYKIYTGLLYRRVLTSDGQCESFGGKNGTIEDCNFCTNTEDCVKGNNF